MHPQRAGSPRLEAKGSRQQGQPLRRPGRVYCNPNDSKGVQGGAKTRVLSRIAGAVMLCVVAFFCAYLIAQIIRSLLDAYGWQPFAYVGAGAVFATFLCWTWAYTSGGRR